MGAPIGGGHATRLTDYWLTVLRRTWKGGVISAFLNPLLYVVAMGVLLGGFIKADPSRLEGATSYLAFVAPGIVATQAMTTVFGEFTYPVMGGIKWMRTYYAMIATPIGPRDIVLSQTLAALARVFVICAIYFVVMAPFGVFTSVWGVLLAALAQVLIAAAFATPIFAFSAWVDNESYFALIFRLGAIPLFLFSGAFFPISNLSAPLEFLARITPLWHGVDLTRMLVLGHVDGSRLVIHLLYLGTLAIGGYLLAVRNLQRRLVV